MIHSNGDIAEKAENGPETLQALNWSSLDGAARLLIPREVPELQVGASRTSTFNLQHIVRSLAVFFLLVGFFLFVPLLQGFSLSAGQGVRASEAVAAVDALAAEEVQGLAARP